MSERPEKPKMSAYYQKARKSITRQSIFRINEKITRNKELVNESTRIMKENLQKSMRRGLDLNDLLSKTDTLEQASNEFAKSAVVVKKKHFYKNIKWAILLAIAVFLLLAIVIVGIGLGFYFKI
jgi:hypothetical protein